MAIRREEYYSKLARGQLNLSAIESLKSLIKQRLALDDIDRQLLAGLSPGTDLPAQLSRLSLQIARGSHSWNGLVVGFPGTKQDLSTNHVGTPFLRLVLYPILELRRRATDHYRVDLPCIYLLGERFSDVFLRKFRFLSQTVPHIIILTKDLANMKAVLKPTEISDRTREKYIQERLCNLMIRDCFKIPTSSGDVALSFVTKELPTCEGTRNPERLDILAIDKHDGSLVAFELKVLKQEGLNLTIFSSKALNIEIGWKTTKWQFIGFPIAWSFIWRMHV